VLGVSIQSMKKGTHSWAGR